MRSTNCAGVGSLYICYLKQIIHAIKKKKRASDFSRPGRLEHGQTQGNAEIPSGYNVKCL